MTKDASKKTSITKNSRLFLTGFFMGVADLIPGVSGGTIAFVSGIYEELLYTIRLLSGDIPKHILQWKFRKAISLIPYSFILPLGLGLFGAIFSMSKLMSYLLESHTTFVFSFFFGLVASSINVVLRKVKMWYKTDILYFVLSTLITYYVVGLIPVDTPKNLLTIFLSGAIAICAMILPGISGSFILLLLGKYYYILDAVNELDVVTIVTFVSGCIFGLSLFSRLLSWLFHHHHDISIIILSGIMLGSMRKIWPWQEVITTRINSHGETVPLVVANVLPDFTSVHILFPIFLILCGFLLVLYLDSKHLTDDKSDDLMDQKYKKEHAQSLKTH